MTLKKTHIAAYAAVLLLGVALRYYYASRWGVPLDGGGLTAGLIVVLFVGLTAGRLGGILAGTAAAAALATSPLAISASLWNANDTYAAAAAALSLYFYRLNPPATSRRRGNYLWAGIFATAAALWRLPFAVLPLYYALDNARALVARDGLARRRVYWWLGVLVLIALAAGLERWVTGDFFSALRTLVVAPAAAGLTAKTLLRRLFADAAAMLFWNPYGFGSLIAIGLAGALFLVRARRPGGGFYGGLLIVSLLVFNFATTSWGGYVPLALDPRSWYLAALPAAILFGLSFATLSSAIGGEELLGPWAAALSLAFLAAALWVNANVPRALIAAAAAGAAVVLTLLFAGLARRRPAAAKTWARAAAAVAVALALVPAIILFSP